MARVSYWRHYDLQTSTLGLTTQHLGILPRSDVAGQTIIRIIGTVYYEVGQQDPTTFPRVEIAWGITGSNATSIDPFQPNDVGVAEDWLFWQYHVQVMEFEGTPTGVTTHDPSHSSQEFQTRGSRVVAPLAGQSPTIHVRRLDTPGTNPAYVFVRWSISALFLDPE